MLTIAQKADILQKTGIAVPAAPAPSPLTAVQEGPATTETSAMVRWTAAVEALFVSYVAARAAKSLRDAEERRQLEMLRALSAAELPLRRRLQRA